MKHSDVWSFDSFIRKAWYGQGIYPMGRALVISYHYPQNNLQLTGD